MTIVTESSSNIAERLKMSGFTIYFLQFLLSAGDLFFSKPDDFLPFPVAGDPKDFSQEFFGAVLAARCAPGPPGVSMKDNCFGCSDSNSTELKNSVFPCQFVSDFSVAVI